VHRRVVATVEQLVAQLQKPVFHPERCVALGRLEVPGAVLGREAAQVGRFGVPNGATAPRGLALGAGTPEQRHRDGESSLPRYDLHLLLPHRLCPAAAARARGRARRRGGVRRLHASYYRLAESLHPWLRRNFSTLLVLPEG
jgi:hypothetical protein